MKAKVAITLALIALTLTGCEDSRTQEQKQRAIDADMASHITEFNYKGHRYLKYKAGVGDHKIAGITHDPDCPCREKGEEE